MTELQIKTIDHLMGAWDELLKSPNPTTAATECSPNCNRLPGVTAANTLDFWTQFAQQWQKTWSDALAYWVKTGKPHLLVANAPPK